MNRTFTTVMLLFFILTNAQAQVPYVVDDCLTSELAQTDFPTGFDLANNGSDLMEWNGTSWIGDWSNAYITIAPPSQMIGCRAVFIGSGVFWTAPGEAFALRLSSPLRYGNTYSFLITYVSHGWGSDGAFSPILSSGNMPVFGNDKYIMNLPPAGYNWESHTITFTASEQQDGDTWLFLKTDENVSSGLISSFCKECMTIATNIASVENKEIGIYPNPASDVLHINGEVDDAAFQVYSVAGAEVYSAVVKNGTNATNYIDITMLNPGYYFLKINSGNQVITRPFIKK